MFLEARGEIRRGVEAHHRTDLRNRIFAVQQQFAGVVEADLADELRGRLARDGLHLQMEVRTAHAKRLAEIVRRELLVVHVLLDDADGLLQELPVHRVGGNLVGVDLRVVRIVVTHPVAGFQQVLDVGREQRDRQRHRQVAVGPGLDARDLLLNAALRGEKHHRDMTCADILLHRLTEFL